jgi:hypothetical protein
VELALDKLKVVVGLVALAVELVVGGRHVYEDFGQFVDLVVFVA